MTKCYTLLCVEKDWSPLVNSWNFLDKYEFVFLKLYPWPTHALVANLIAVDVYSVGWAPSAEFVVVEDLFSPWRWLEGLYRTLGELVDLILSSCHSLDFLQTK